MAIGTDRIDVMPPSTSYEETLEPALCPVTSARVPEVTPPSWRLVESGLARSHWPAVAVSIPRGLRTQPRSPSKSSKKGPQLEAVLPMTAYVQPAASISIRMAAL